ncbi:YHYH domain-containing protein [Skermanella sp. TT6]|uniref:YHYH domain-containing protein n=1 Tax=Skermanella cutis TaxID=2775420 RepID=A0ABX7B889_9PROT|nr:YHYH domain-containing protein [Skermanella sp. TT6]
MRLKLVAVLSAFALLLPSIAFAHPSGMDRKGCHHDRKNGGYHLPLTAWGHHGSS